MNFVFVLTFPISERLKYTWNTTPIKWYPLPLSTGIALLIFIRWRKLSQENQGADSVEVTLSPEGQTLKIKRPFHIHVLGALPLRSMSRLWGYLNSLELPVWFRPIGFKIYAFIFDCNLDEIDPKDLTAYKSLGEFFYRKLASDSRPIEPALLMSISSGLFIRFLHFGTITDLERVEQVKGVTYSLDALLGSSITPSDDNIEIHTNRDHSLASNNHFANVNGIDYSLEQLMGSKPMSEISANSNDSPGPFVSTSPSSLKHDIDVAITGSLSSNPPSIIQSFSPSINIPWIRSDNALYFAVVYLAPGDYHRFHSPSNWVVKSRRHFIGKQRFWFVDPHFTLQTEMETSFSKGATNVGSIKINFDRDLRTNTQGHRPKPKPGSFVEASYANASVILGGQPLKVGDEMGGFCLGSTIVLVFEAPKSFEFSVHEGQRIKVGQKLGDIIR
ncbi:hypothetical protein Clacol_003610 [Clathrus columnatus]|uniref:Phosphatidylserine decarboxylase n=1 Tax=Clathrus columnatus TaxID=1419009 RepID=A0AAV5A9Q6_9AGAM|nr:hypothetical protein Clacol_003610 [Clathrus columnatus]